MVNRVLGRVQLAEIEHVEPGTPQDLEQLRVADVELGARSDLVVGPVQAVHPLQRPDQLLPYVLGVRRAHHLEVGASHEHELAAPSEQPSGLRDPAFRIAPQRRAVFGEGEVERRIREWHVLGVGLEELEAKAELLVHLTRRVELRGGDVHAHDPAGAEPLEPGPEVGGSTAQLDHVQPAHLGQHLDLRLGRVPLPPGDLFLRP